MLSVRQLSCACQLPVAQLNFPAASRGSAGLLSLRGKDAGFEGMRFDNKKFDKGFEGNGDRRGKEVGTEITEHPRGSARGQCLLVDRPGDSVLIGSGDFRKDIVATH